MKITKTRLKQIIKEELESVVSEQDGVPSWPADRQTGLFQSVEAVMKKRQL